MSQKATAAGALTPDITSILTPTSSVTYEDRVDAGSHELVWDIKVDGQVIRTLPYDDELDAEHVVGLARERVEAMRERGQLVGGIRELADFLERHPEVGAPTVLAWLSTVIDGDKVFRPAVEALLSDYPDAEVTVDEHRVTASRRFGSIEFKVEGNPAKVCEQRTTLREVTEPVLPDWAQPTQVAA